MTDVIITESQFKLPDGFQVYRKTWAVRLLLPLPVLGTELTSATADDSPGRKTDPLSWLQRPHQQHV